MLALSLKTPLDNKQYKNMATKQLSIMVKAATHTKTAFLI